MSNITRKKVELFKMSSWGFDDKLIDDEKRVVRRAIIKKLKRVGIDTNIFKTGKSGAYEFFESDLHILESLYFRTYSFVDINKITAMKTKTLKKNEIESLYERLEKDVLFFCQFLDGYLIDKDLELAKNKVRETLKPKL